MADSEISHTLYIFRHKLVYDGKDMSKHYGNIKCVEAKRANSNARSGSCIVHEHDLLDRVELEVRNLSPLNVAVHFDKPPQLPAYEIELVDPDEEDKKAYTVEYFRGPLNNPELEKAIIEVIRAQIKKEK